MRRIDYLGYLIEVRTKEAQTVAGTCCWVAAVWVSKSGRPEEIRLELTEMFSSEMGAKTAALMCARRAISRCLAGESNELAVFQPPCNSERV
jgi:hypothetical protein